MKRSMLFGLVAATLTAVGCGRGYVGVYARTAPPPVLVETTGPRRARGFRASLYARVSSNDEELLPMKIRARRDHTARRCWTILVLVYILNLCAANCASAERALVLTGGTVYTRPDAAPMTNAVVVVRGNTVSAIGFAGRGTDVERPPLAR